MAIPRMPAIIPKGMPINPMIKPSKNTELRFCFLVAPILDNIPKCLDRSETDIAKEL